MIRPPSGERVYRLLLRAYPRAFRERYHAGLIEAFREQSREPRYEGAWGRARFWLEIGVDWARAVVVARRQDGMTGAAGDGTTWTGTTRGKGGVVMGTLRQDLGFAIRSLARAPGFTAVAVMTLAVGIGSTAAIFGVVRQVLLEPLPYDQPDRVITLWSSWADDDRSWVSEAEYRTYLTRTRAFEDLAAWNQVSVNFTDPERPERVLAVGATPNLMSTLGVEPVLGRFFTVDEALLADSTTAEVIVISHEAWMRRWGGLPSVLGSRTEMNGRLREIVGVLPEGFRLPTQFGRAAPADIYFPQHIDREPVVSYPSEGGSHGLYVAGRLASGVSVQEADMQLSQAIEAIDAEFGAYPPATGFRPLVLAAHDDVFGAVRPALLAIFATVGFVLLIACANVANLLLARSDERADELSVRAALGAGRSRLVSQLLVESAVLAACAGALGSVLAWGGIEALKALDPGNLPRVHEIEPDTGVFLFAGAVGMVTVLVFGTWPALQGTRDKLSSAGRRRVGAGSPTAKWQAVLVSVETALALVLALGAGLTARTFEGLTAIDPGFSGGNAVTAAVSLPFSRYPDAAASTAFYREALRSIGALPNVRSTGAIRSVPLLGALGDWGIDVDCYDESTNPRAAAGWQIASPGYFESMGIPLHRGRDFQWTDEADAPPVVMVNEALVRRFWPGEEALGKRLRVSGGEWATVVGVVGDVLHDDLTGVAVQKFYVPIGQWTLVQGGNPNSLRLVVATVGAPGDVVQPIRDIVRAMDPGLALSEVRTIDDVLHGVVAQPRLLAALMGVFGSIALILALVGVYGVVSYGVGRRTREIGVRMALGAVRDEVVRLMLRQAAAMVVWGLLLGTVLSIALGGLLESQLYGVSPTDPATYLAVITGFALVAVAATYLPARRAASIDPVRALEGD